MSHELKLNQLNHSDFKLMYANIGHTYDQPADSFREKTKKLGKIILGVLFLIGAFFAHPFNNSKNISAKFEQLTGLPPKMSGLYFSSVSFVGDSKAQK